jgi:hypothetical protein
MRRLAVCVAAGAALVFASSARADDLYTTSTCRTPDGRGASADGWTSHGAVDRQNGCMNGGDLFAGSALHPFAQQEGAGWSFTAPADTRITAYALLRTVRMEAGSNWAWNYSLLRNRIEGTSENYAETCWAISGCYALGNGVSNASRVGHSGLDIGALHVFVDCNPAGCPAGSGANLLRIHRGEFVLRDLADPVFSGTPSGDLLDPTRPVGGVRTVSFSATDRGGGVYQARLEVDGTAVTTVDVDQNNGRCRKPFTGAVPCKLSASGTLSYDTSALADGQHAVRLVVTDATGTNAAVYGPVQITTANQPVTCAPGSASVLGLRFASTRRTKWTRRGGRAFSVMGTLAGATPGTVITLLTREVRSGAPRIAIATTVTGEGGAYRVRVPAGGSRTIRVGYRPLPTSTQLHCSKSLRLRVPARVTFSARRTKARRFRMSGRLLGGSVPVRGKVVELQGFENGRWREFRTLRSRADGRFSTRYRFKAASAGRRFRLRVRVRAEASYPFSTGYSRVVRVRVR